MSRRITFGGRLLAARERDPRTHLYRGGAVAVALAGFGLFGPLIAVNSDRPGWALASTLLLVEAAVVVPLCSLFGVAAVRRNAAEGGLSLLAVAEPRRFSLGMNLLTPVWVEALVLVCLQFPVALLCVTFGGVGRTAIAAGGVLVCAGAVAAAGVGSAVAVRIQDGLLASGWAVGLSGTAAVLSGIGTAIADSTTAVYAVVGVFVAASATAAVAAFEVGRVIFQHPNRLRSLDHVPTTRRFRRTSGVGRQEAFAWKACQLESPFGWSAWSIDAAAIFGVVNISLLLTVGAHGVWAGEMVAVTAAVNGSIILAARTSQRVAVDSQANQGQLFALLPGGPRRSFRRSRQIERTVLRASLCGCAAGLLLASVTDGAGVYLLQPGRFVVFVLMPSGVWLAGRAAGVLSVRLGPGVGVIAGPGLAVACVAAGAALVAWASAGWLRDVYGYAGIAARVVVALLPVAVAAALLRPRESDDPWLDPTPRRWLRRYGPE